ncbi:MAG TPA: aminotransferase class I/II-fold pyridoxal phosphate-dependent enzyme [Actinomycetota bacterium]|nr:aminotransferase class I/II-fold pyridoxal phosphate-dependent enzyme [Actinomycetota bacterium]
MTPERLPADDDLVRYRDPEASREALLTLGAAVWTDALDWLYGRAAEVPTEGLTYEASRERFFGAGGEAAAAPEHGRSWRAVLADVRERVGRDAFSHAHPRTFAYFTPPPLPMAIAGDVWAPWLNQGVDIWQGAPSATFVEEEVVAWLRSLVGYPEDGFGVLTSGGAMANLMALSVARDHVDASEGRPRASGLGPMRLYGSDQTHFSITRALDILGFDGSTFRAVPTDDRFHIDVDALVRAIEQDLAAGARPFAIVAVAGATNTGAVDPIPAVADVAERFGLWVHVDAAYGGAVRLSERDAARVPGLERADSVTLDPHKWFFQPYDIGGLLVRRRDDLADTFHRAPEYLRSSHDEPLDWYHFTLEGTRRFRGLKLWMSWQHLGTRGFGELVERTNDLAAYLADRCRDDPMLELAVDPPELSVVCFRIVPAAGLGERAVDEHQDRVQRELERSRAGWLSTTTLRGRTYLRAGVMNHMGTEADIDGVLDAVRTSSRAVTGGASTA